jgi:hypothetical protein
VLETPQNLPENDDGNDLCGRSLPFYDPVRRRVDDLAYTFAEPPQEPFSEFFGRFRQHIDL